MWVAAPAFGNGELLGDSRGASGRWTSDQAGDVTLELDETATAVAESLARLDSASPPDFETLLAVRDISRGYFDRQLIQQARILPSVQPRFDPGDLVAIEPLFQKARQLVELWEVGSIGGPLQSAEDETAAMLCAIDRASEASPPGP